MKSNQLDQQIKSIFETRKQIVISAGLVSAMVVLVIMVIIPQFRSAFNNHQKLSKEEDKLTKLRAKAAALDSALVSPEFLQADIVNKSLPSKKPLLELLTGLGNILYTSGVKLERLELSPGLIATDSGQVKPKTRAQDTLDLDIDVSGSFSEVEKFMSLVEEMTPFTSIKTFSLSENVNAADNATSDKPLIRASMQTQTHFFVQTVSKTLENPLGTISDAEREVLRDLSLYKTPEFIIPDSITGGGGEDLFGVKGYAEELRLFYQSQNDSGSNGLGEGGSGFGGNGGTHEIEPI